MRKLMVVLASLFFFVAESASGEILPRAIQSGDVLIFDVQAPTQTPGNPVVFEKKPDRILRVTVNEEGNRTYTHASSGKPFAVTTPFITKIEDRGVPIEEPNRFRHFPPGEFPKPGKKWTVNFISAAKPGNRIWLDATSDDGPSIAVMIDGKETFVKTVQVNYEGGVNSPDWDSNGAKIMAKILFAPDLQEIVFNQFVSYDRSGFLNKGYRSSLRAIKSQPSN